MRQGWAQVLCGFRHGPASIRVRNAGQGGNNVVCFGSEGGKGQLEELEEPGMGAAHCSVYWCSDAGTPRVASSERMLTLLPRGQDKSQARSQDFSLHP